MKKLLYPALVCGLIIAAVGFSACSKGGASGALYATSRVDCNATPSYSSSPCAFI